MIQYTENTRGWWLSKLKEPLRVQALTLSSNPIGDCDSLECAIQSILDDLIEGSILWVFWRGVFVCYFGGLHIDSTNFKDGFDLAYECRPTREDESMTWEDTAAMLQYNLNNELQKAMDGGEDKAIVDSPAPKAFEGFNKWMEAHGRPNLSSDELLNLNEYPKILYDETFLYPGESPKPKDSWEVEPAVVGYEIPKPIDTIEKKHELRIQALEARVKQLEDHLWNYLGIKCK